jgi:phosphoheptose isomerase
MASSAEKIRRLLEESGRLKRSFSDELVGRIGQFAEKNAAALHVGGRVVFFGNGGSAPMRYTWWPNLS